MNSRRQFCRKKKEIKKGSVAAICAAALLSVTFAGCGNSSDTSREEEYRQYGINCLESGKYQEAVEAFDNALGQSVGKVGELEIDICFYKAEAQYLGGDTDAAFETYDAVINYDGDGRAYYLRGNLYYECGDADSALSDYDMAVASDPSNYEIYIGIYTTLSANGKEEEGEQYLEEALNIKGEKTDDKFYKGQICYFLGEYGDAIEELTDALSGGKDIAAYYLGLSYEAQGDDKSAQEYIDEYLDSGIATSFDMYDLGVAEMSDGDYAQALVYFNAGLSLQSVPNKQNLMKNAIICYEYSGDFSSAREMLSEYVDLYPTDEDAQKEMTFLETR